MIESKALKRKFINAAASGNRETARRLLNLIKLGEGKELPIFIQYRKVNDMIHTCNMSMTPQEFEFLKQDVSQFISWENG